MDTFYSIPVDYLCSVYPKWNDIQNIIPSLCTYPSSIPSVLGLVREVERCLQVPASLHEVDDREQYYNNPSIINEEWTWIGTKFEKRLVMNPTCIFYRLNELLNKVLGTELTPRGIFYYPRGSCHVWHSNQFHPHGWRMYIVVSRGESYFSYLEPISFNYHRVKESPFSIHLFKVGTAEETLYHSVVSFTDRWSFGWWIEEDAVKRLIHLVAQGH